MTIAMTEVSIIALPVLNYEAICPDQVCPDPDLHICQYDVFLFPSNIVTWLRP